MNRQPRAVLDDIDLRILELLGEDARRTVTDIAQQVNLSVAPVKRRIDRLEHSGVIRGYTVVVARGTASDTIEALLTATLTAGEATDLQQWLQKCPEVVHYSLVTGEADILARLRCTGVDDLQRFVTALRARPEVNETRTSLVLGAWDRTGATARR